MFIQCEKAVPGTPGACQIHNCTFLNTFITWKHNKGSRDTCFPFGCQQNTSNKLSFYFLSKESAKAKGGTAHLLFPFSPCKERKSSFRRDWPTSSTNQNGGQFVETVGCRWGDWTGSGKADGLPTFLRPQQKCVYLFIMAKGKGSQDKDTGD